MADTVRDIQDTAHEPPDEALMRAQARHELAIALWRTLPPDEHRVLIGLYGLHGEDEQSLLTIARRLGCTVKQAQLLHDQACCRLALVPGLRQLFARVCQDRTQRRMGQLHEIRRGE